MPEANSDLDRAQASSVPASGEPAGIAADLITNTGYYLRVRPALPEDREKLAGFLAALSPEDSRHRFPGLRGRDRVENMLGSGDRSRLSFLAFERFTDELIAAATLDIEESDGSAQFAVVTRSDRKSRGVSWSLLQHVLAYARQAGIRRLQSIEHADDQRALKLEREMGFTVHSCLSDERLMIAEKILD